MVTGNLVNAVNRVSYISRIWKVGDNAVGRFSFSVGLDIQAGENQILWKIL